MKKIYPSNGEIIYSEYYNPRLSERRGAIKVIKKIQSSSCYSCTSILNLQICKVCKKITCSECLENTMCVICSNNYISKKKCCLFF